MKTQYVITVYRTTGNQMQRYNAEFIQDALVIVNQHKSARFVHKVELSIILETWTALRS